VRSVDLAVYADLLAAEAASLSARVERARQRLRQAAIEHEARCALPEPVVARLEALGVLAAPADGDEAREIEEAKAALEALALLQGWVERELYTATALPSPVSSAAM
jgi:hypothetical protein